MHGFYQWIATINTVNTLLFNCRNIHSNYSLASTLLIWSLNTRGYSWHIVSSMLCMFLWETALLMSLLISSHLCTLHLHLTYPRITSVKALTHTQSSICAVPLPDILWPVGQQQGVVCPAGTRGVPSRLQALSNPSCAVDGPCPWVLRKCVDSLWFIFTQ